jgi:hypothetical protein
MNWIDIKERRPEFEVPVLVCQQGKDTSLMIARLVSTRTSKDYVIHDFTDGCTGLDDYLYSVTHWMPLPELP